MSSFEEVKDEYNASREMERKKLIVLTIVVWTTVAYRNT